jgi:protein phosphatase
LFIVADGMGGHNAGREASELAVETLGNEYFASDSRDVETSLRHGFAAANTRIYRQSTSGPAFAGMGTTCTALVLTNGRAFIGHIGDSRIYRITRTKITQLTEDHSRVAELVRRAIITKEQARVHPERSQLYRAMGTRPEVDVDIVGPLTLPRSCHFLMCTDGLFNHVTEDEMQSIVLARPPAEACSSLIALANERGGHDNITLQIITTTSTGRGPGKVQPANQRRSGA